MNKHNISKMSSRELQHLANRYEKLIANYRGRVDAIQMELEKREAYKIQDKHD